jgi:hypothetical protein
MLFLFSKQRAQKGKKSEEIGRVGKLRKGETNEGEGGRNEERQGRQREGGKGDEEKVYMKEEEDVNKGK